MSYHVKNSACFVDIDFVFYNDDITLTVVEQKFDFENNRIAKNEIIQITIKTFDFFVKISQRIKRLF